ncbi:MAG: hypothetical protein RL095_3807 [Verrucomicrobiota bacterium]
MLETEVSTSSRFDGRGLSGRYDPGSGNYSLCIDEAILAPDAGDPQAFTVTDNDGREVRIRVLRQHGRLKLEIEDAGAPARELSLAEKVWSGVPLVLVIGGGFIGGACGGAAAGVNWAIFRSNLGRPAAWAASGAVSLVALGLYLGLGLGMQQAIRGAVPVGQVAAVAAEIPNVTIDNGSDEDLSLWIDGVEKLKIPAAGIVTLKMDPGECEFRFVNAAGKDVETLRTEVPEDQALLINPLGLNRYHLCTLTYVKLPAIGGGGEAFGGALAEKCLRSDFGLLEELPGTLEVKFFAGSSETVQRSKIVKVPPAQLSPAQALGLLALERESLPRIYRDGDQSALRAQALSVLAKVPASPKVRQSLLQVLQESRPLPPQLFAALAPYEGGIEEARLLAWASDGEGECEARRVWALSLALKRGLGAKLAEELGQHDAKQRLAVLRLLRRDWHLRSPGEAEARFVQALARELLKHADPNLTGEIADLMGHPAFPLAFEDDQSLRQAWGGFGAVDAKRRLGQWNQILIRRLREGRLPPALQAVVAGLLAEADSREAVFDAFLQQGLYEPILACQLSPGETCRLLQKTGLDAAKLLAQEKSAISLRELAWSSLVSTDEELRRQSVSWLARVETDVSATLRRGFANASRLPEESQRKGLRNAFWENFYPKLGEIPLADLPQLMAASRDSRWIKYGFERLVGADQDAGPQLAALAAKWPEFDAAGRLALLQALQFKKSPVFRPLLKLGLGDADVLVSGQALENALAGEDPGFPEARTCAAVISAQTEAKRRDELQQKWDGRQIAHWRGLAHQEATRQQAAAALLQIALASPSERSRRSALQQTPRLKEDDGALITQVRQLLVKEKDAEARRIAWNLLLQLDGATGRSQGLLALQDRSAAVRELAFQHLLRRDLRKDAALVTELRMALGRETDEKTRARMEGLARRLPK